jgi:hypothetical protein
MTAKKFRQNSLVPGGDVSETENRERLAAYLTDLIEGYAWAHTGEEAAAHTATVLGWRPPARVVNSAADLDALPDDSIIRTCYGTVTQKVDDCWEVPNEVGRYLSESVDLPATVLYEPEPDPYDGMTNEDVEPLPDDWYRDVDDDAEHQGNADA